MKNHKNKKQAKNILKNNKVFIYGMILILIITLVPNIIKIYNIYTPIKVNEMSYIYYKNADIIYNDLKTNIEDICHIDQTNKEYKDYILKDEYKNHKDAKIIEKKKSKNIGEQIIVYSNYEVLLKKKEIKNNNNVQIYYAQLDSLYKNKLDNSQYIKTLKNSNHEIISDYLTSLHNLTTNDNFKYIDCKNIDAKKQMLNNYNLKLKYEIEELTFMNNTIKYFKQYLKGE